MVTPDPGIVRHGSMPDSMRPLSASARSLEWYITAVTWDLLGREQHSNDCILQRGGCPGSQTLSELVQFQESGALGLFDL